MQVFEEAVVYAFMKRLDRKPNWTKKEIQKEYDEAYRLLIMKSRVVKVLVLPSADEK